MPMYEFSYTEVIDDSHQVMRARERSAMDRVIDMLRAARDRGAKSREAVEAIYYLRRLWAIYLDDLRDPENELPEQLRAGIISIGIWMNKEIDRFRTGQTNDLTPIIEINEIIRDGLK
jgi:flagellar protein FlaF